MEFEAVRTLLLGAAGSEVGKDLIRGLAPSTDPGEVREALAHTSEGVALLRGLGRQPYHDLPAIGALLSTVRVAGSQLSPGDLLDLASFMDGGGEIARAVARAETSPRLARLASEVRDLSTLAGAIRRAILPSGEVADDASPRLADLRRRMARLRSQLHSVMDSLLRGKDSERVLQERLITTRNERYVLLVKAEQRAQLPGIIHGSSGSGASLFVEPMPAVELNNDLVALAEEEQREVVRILRELTARVGDEAETLEASAQLLGQLDAVQARAVLAQEMGAVAPQIVDELTLELYDARHPLLRADLCERLGLPRRSSREPVPVSLEAGSRSPVLVISGPNTGGKTVALKTVGLFALMAQCGLHVPVGQGSRLPVFRRIFADIGDEQSITADLSTFSAHLAAIVEMTADLELPALVLLDEVGAGTDPTEGGGLGVAIVEHFRARGAMVVATTHHGLMKAYAQATADVTCASFGYDPETYEPTYKLSLGTPGRSLALEMAERLGLPPVVVADARSRLSEGAAQTEALLKQLEGERTALGTETERILAERRGLEEERRALRRAAAELQARKRAEIASFVKELKRRGEEAARKAAEAIEQAVRRVETTRRSAATVATRARGEAVKAIRRAQEELLRDPDLGLPEEPQETSGELVVGGRVRVRELGVVGDLVKLQDREAEVSVQGKRMRVPRSTLVALSASAPTRGRGGAPAFDSPRRPDVPAEINLVGLTVDEALPRVDKLLDDAALSERRELRVIHGFGQGRLRTAVAGLLEGHPHVSAFRPGGTGEGGAGVTIVELKD